MDKAEQFLWIVQTMVLANASNLASNPKWAEEHRVSVSASGAFIVMDTAVRASQKIPANMTVGEAANEFCSYMIRNLRLHEEEASGKRASCPAWFAMK